MSFKAIVYAYIIGGFTFVPLVLASILFYTIYSSVPVNNSDKPVVIDEQAHEAQPTDSPLSDEQEQLPFGPRAVGSDINDVPKQRKGWLTVRRTFEESTFDGGYVTLMKSFLDSRSKDPKKSRPKDTWFVALKGKVLYLYEDEAMTECEAAIELGGHDVVIYPEGLLDGELFAKRNAICLKPKPTAGLHGMPSVTKEMKLGEDAEGKPETPAAVIQQMKREAIREEAMDASTPWFIFVRSNIEMEDWYLAMIHASDNPANAPTLNPLLPIFDPADMAHLVETLDEQPDVIPMRWLNALIGRVFFSYYRTHLLEEYIIGRLMKKLSKVKRPAFLTDVNVTEVSVGNSAPVLSKPMLKELTKEGDASLEVHLAFKGEVRITAQAVVTIDLGSRFKKYSVKLVLAVVLREIEGNLLVKVKRPPSSRIWYAFTAPPRLVLDVEPVVSDRQITWNMVLSTIEARLKEIILESIVMPNMDDIAYFGSLDYLHRGGIWADAVRREKHTTPDSDPTQPIPPPPSEAEVAESIASTPAIVPPVEEIKPLLNHSRSAEELRKEEPITTPEIVTARTTTLASQPATTAGRRRTWLSSVLGNETDSSEDEEFSDSGSRGRESYPRGLTPTSSRSTSSHSDGVPDRPHDNGLLSPSPKRPPPLPPRSSPSRERERYEGPPITPPRSPQFSRTSTSTSTATTSTSPPTSFFSTLKARAGDKQALSNTAKEAMKKWSVNWGASRREASDDAPDAGTQDRDYQNKRGSYAEIRRNVEDRQRTTSMVEPGDMDTHLPNGLHDMDRVTNTPSLNGRRGLRAGSVSGMFSSTHPPVIDSSISTSSENKESTELPGEVSDAPAPLPIHTQPPQAKTMTIPGIHASHRGEVMSMGYVPDPSPSPPEPKQIAPAIQSVYRLWKNPSNQQNLETQHEASVSDASSTRSPPKPNMIPPPLPPRSVSTTIIRPSSETPRSNANGFNDPSSASAALKTIATQDETRRGSMERVEVAEGLGNQESSSS